MFDFSDLRMSVTFRQRGCIHVFHTLHTQNLVTRGLLSVHTPKVPHKARVLGETMRGTTAQNAPK